MTTALVICVVALSLLVGGVIGYAVGHRAPSEGVATPLDGVLGRLCDVVERQSDTLRANTRQAVDAALVPQDDQIERVSGDAIRRYTEASFGAHHAPARDPDPDPGFDEFEIPTELP